MVWQGEGLASVIPIKPERLRRVSATISRGFIGGIICRLHAALRHIKKQACCVPSNLLAVQLQKAQLFTKGFHFNSVHATLCCAIADTIGTR